MTDERKEDSPDRHVALPIDKRVFLVTGGDQARGRAVAEALARAGAKTIAITYGEDREAAHEVYLALQVMGAGCLLAQMDVTERASVRRVLLWVTDQVGKIDVVVNAEEAPWPANLDGSSREDRSRAIAVNVRAPLLTADEVLPFMGIQRTGGLVIGIGIAEGVSAALRAVEGPGTPSTVADVISPMTALAATRRVTLTVVPHAPDGLVVEAVVQAVLG